MSDPVRLPTQQIEVRQRDADPLLTMLDRAIREPEFPIDRLEAVLRIYNEQRAEAARQEYYAEMGAAQSEMGQVLRDAPNTQTHSKYAKLESIDDAIRPHYTRHGFSLTFGTMPATDPEAVRVVCTCAHRGGHVERYELEARPDTSGARGTVNKTALHGLGSTLSYLRRYLTMLIWNVVLTNEDDDGIAGGMGENYRRSPPPPRPVPPPPKRRTVSDALDEFEEECRNAMSPEEAEAILDGADTKRLERYCTAPAARARYDGIVAELTARFFVPPDGEGDDDTGSDGATPPRND